MTKTKTGLADGEFSAKEKVEFAVFNDATLSKETITEWMVKDMRGIQVLIAEVLGSKECIDALATVFYNRYTELQKSKVSQPELDLEGQ